MDSNLEMKLTQRRKDAKKTALALPLRLCVSQFADRGLLSLPRAGVRIAERWQPLAVG